MPVTASVSGCKRPWGSGPARCFNSRLKMSDLWWKAIGEELGHAVSTNVRREEFALLDIRAHFGLYQALSLAIDRTPPSSRIFPFSIQPYN